jgi:hypothetical protein
MRSDQKPYSQRLPEVGLSIERYTESVPDDGRWYLLRDGEQLGSYRSIKAAQAAWQAVLSDIGWTSTPRKVDGKEALEREKWAKDRDARMEYWHSGRRHSW